jgi:hypothetical protein
MTAYIAYLFLRWFTVRVICNDCGIERTRRLKIGGGNDVHEVCADCKLMDTPGFREWLERQRNNEPIK